jgi:hypothetical protein
VGWYGGGKRGEEREKERAGRAKDSENVTYLDIDRFDLVARPAPFLRVFVLLEYLAQRFGVCLHNFIQPVVVQPVITEVVALYLRRYHDLDGQISQRILHKCRDTFSESEAR